MLLAQQSPVIVGQVKRLWVAPTLARLPGYLLSQSAVNLITGTGAAESQWYQYIGQNGGPALGFWNMEPFTHDDCWRNFLRYRPDIQSAVLSILNGTTPSAELMTMRIDYAIAMCRVKYFRASAPLPQSDSATDLSAYHKTSYNSALGKADPAANIPYFQAAILV